MPVFKAQPTAGFLAADLIKVDEAERGAVFRREPGKDLMDHAVALFRLDYLFLIGGRIDWIGCGFGELGMAAMGALHLEGDVLADAVNEGAKALRVGERLVRPEIAQDAKQGLLADIFDQFGWQIGIAEPDLDGSVEMGKEFPFGIRVRFAQSADEVSVECLLLK
jgi:hypothetical protein